MKTNKAQITSNSIKQSGLPTDFKKAISEYIWNGFDADATEIEINFDYNDINSILSFSISDNGHGVDFSNLDETFGYFLDSNKSKSFDQNRFLKGKKGKGRFSFQQFCTKTDWDTVYYDVKSEKHLSYKIEIHSSSLNDYKTSDTKISPESITGTTATFYNFTSITADLLYSSDFNEYLCNEFGWFLFLNKEKDYVIKINGVNLDFHSAINKHIEKQITIGEDVFDVSFILWKNNINEKYYYYFLNSELVETGRKHTKFNNKTPDFHHSVYIVSKFFLNFHFTKENQPTLGFEENQSNPTFKILVKYLNDLITEEQKLFIREQKADGLIANYKRNNIFPVFKNNAYDNIRKQDLENIVKELYCINPNLFDGLKIQQQKTFVGFLNLLLDSEQRDSILNIMESVIDLTEDERTEFSRVLNKTNISNITSLVRLLENRKNVINVIEKLVYDLEKFTDERNHIQTLVENNYWLFGEQYHLVSADLNFERMLNNYLVFMEEGKKEKEKIESKEKLKRPDVFICRKNCISDSSISENILIEENIIVELKRPSIVIGKTQYDQIEGYIRFIIKEPRFNSTLRNWKLILVGKEVDDWIKDRYESNENKGKKFLIEAVKNYEIYAYTWDDLTRIFASRHDYLLEKLGYKDFFNKEIEGIDKNPDKLLKMIS